MEVTIKVKGINISHEDLVNLFSTGFCGNDYMRIRYPLDIPSLINPEDPNKFYHNDRKNNPDNCLEDRIATLLLNGYSIGLEDYEDEYDTEKEALAASTGAGKPYMAVSDNNWYGDEIWYPVYKVDLMMIMDQFKKILEGTAKCSYDNIKQNFDAMFNKFGNPDFYDAWNLIQYIIFDDVIYG